MKGWLLKVDYLILVFCILLGVVSLSEGYKNFLKYGVEEYSITQTTTVLPTIFTGCFFLLFSFLILLNITTIKYKEKESKNAENRQLALERKVKWLEEDKKSYK